MGLLDSLFGKKIILTPEMENMANQMIENNWFENCGKTLTFGSNYKIESVNNIHDATNKLSYKRDHGDFVTLDNLIIEANRRKQLFLSLYHKNEIEYTWNKLTNAIVKAYISNHKFDVDTIQRNFDAKVGVQADLKLRRIFIDTLNEIYFKNNIENFPSFFTNIVDIYLNGHVIVGWIGKFGSHEIQVRDIDPISPNDGILNVW